MKRKIIAALLIICFMICAVIIGEYIRADIYNDQLVKEDNQIIPCMISSTASRNNYQPTPVEGEDASRVLKKVNEIQ